MFKASLLAPLLTYLAPSPPPLDETFMVPTNDFLVIVLYDSLVAPPHHSSRVTWPLTWTSDYIYFSLGFFSTHYPIITYISFTKVLPKQFYYISRILKEQESSSYFEVAKDLCWQQARKTKICALIEKNTWELFP